MHNYFHKFRRDRKQWRCNDCRHTFSISSGTIFANHKLPLKKYLVATAIFANAMKGISALQLSRDLGVQYKTAFVLAHKPRESLMVQRKTDQLSGEIHMDGAYVNGHIRPKNKKEDRIDRRLFENQRPDKRCIFVMRQKFDPTTEGAANHSIYEDTIRSIGREGHWLNHEKSTIRTPLSKLLSKVLRTLQAQTIHATMPLYKPYENVWKNLTEKEKRHLLKISHLCSNLVQRAKLHLEYAVLN